MIINVYTYIKGELNPETNVGLNEYLREIKFCTGQESVDVVQRKKNFNDKNHYLFTYFKKCVLREDGSSYRPYYTFIYATSAFTKTGTNVQHDSLHSPVFSNAPPSFQTP